MCNNIGLVWLRFDVETIYKATPIVTEKLGGSCGLM